LLWSFVYLVARNLVALVWLLARSRRSKELEILVLRHELKDPGKLGGSDARFRPGGRRCSCDVETEEVPR
jgi:hypothetical protein